MKNIIHVYERLKSFPILKSPESHNLLMYIFKIEYLKIYSV